MPDRVLFDVNVLLDVIENREPHVEWSGPALLMAEQKHIDGFIAANTIDILAFLLRKKASSAQIHSIIGDLLTFLEVAPVTSESIHSALSLRWTDPEDAILYEVAKNAGCTTIVTRNVRDFKAGDDNVRVLSPENLVRFKSAR